jgi:carbohydrate-selective porin OprB
MNRWKSGARIALSGCIAAVLTVTFCRAQQESGSPQPIEAQVASVAATDGAQISMSAAGRARFWLEQKGFSGKFSLVNDWSTNFCGGASSIHSVERYLLDTSIALDTRKAFGWSGGTAFVRLHHHLGDHGGDYVGDAQGFSNIDDVPRTMLYELWLEQKFSGEKVRVKLGKMDANADFASVENGGDFMNSSMGYSPTILRLPTYPQPRPGASLFVQPTSHDSVSVGFFDTAGPGMMMLGEVGRRWTVRNDDLPGRIGLGAWRLTGNLPALDGGSSRATAGYYAVFEQGLWHESSRAVPRGESVAAYLQWGYADPSLCAFQRHLGAGVVWRAPLPKRGQDSLGMGVTQVRLAGASGPFTSELVTESYYKIHVKSFLSISADVQYIHQPGGSMSYRDAVVFTPRVQVAF